MRIKLNPEIRELLNLVRLEVDADQDLFVVGGAIRDGLVERDVHDLDFVMSKDPTPLARRLAKRLGVNFYVLDDERHTARVLYRLAEGRTSPLDFVQFTGDDLEQDLRNRDFTVNAMAVSVQDLETLIDPLDGRQDLAKGLIRPCSAHALLDDPVRVLRGVRLALQFNFRYAENLPAMMREASAHLPETSYERQRDEFFKILEGPRPADGMRDCQRFDVFAAMIPCLQDQLLIPVSPPHELPLFEHTLKVVRQYAFMLDRLTSARLENEDAPWWLEKLITDLGAFADRLLDYHQEEITLGRTKRGLALLGALLHDAGKPSTMELGDDGNLHYYGHAEIGSELAYHTAKRLQLSNAESDWVRTLVENHMQLIPMARAETPPDRREVYYFFNQVGEVGVAIALHYLADTLATYQDQLTPHKWARTTQTVRRLLEGWFEERYTIVSPTLLLNGDDLQRMFGLQPGKRIGQMLRMLEEAQASGEVETQEAAIAFIKSRL